MVVLRKEKQLKPIVQKMIKSMYGGNMKHVTIRIAEKFTMKPDYWDVAVDFRDNANQYTVDFEINAINGRVTSAREIIKWKLR